MGVPVLYEWFVYLKEELLSDLFPGEEAVEVNCSEMKKSDFVDE